MTKEIKFSIFRPLFNLQGLTREIYDNLCDCDLEKFNDEKDYYKVERLIKNNLLMFTFFYGAATPYSEEVLDVLSGVEKPNGRKPTDAELRNQLFLVVNLETNLMYLSGNKKNIVLNWLNTIRVGEVVLTNVYNDIDEFLANLKTVESIKLVSLDSLMTRSTELFKAAVDVLGFDSPEKIEIKVGLENRKKTSDIEHILKRLFSKHNLEEQNLSSLVCVGADDSGIEMVLNIDKFSKKLKINVELDSYNMIDPEVVLTQFIKVI